MANSYTLTMTNINLSAIDIEVGGRIGDPLSTTEVKIKKYNGTSFIDFTEFSINNPTETTATIDPNVDFLQTDMLLIQINDFDTSFSDRVLVDFAQDYDGIDHDASYVYELPSEVGSYKIQLDKVNGTDFSSVETASFTVGNAPTAPNSSVVIDKPYLVKYTGQILGLRVTLNNAAGDAPEGNYEVSIDADLQ